MIELVNKAKELDVVLWNFIDKYIDYISKDC